MKSCRRMLVILLLLAGLCTVGYATAAVAEEGGCAEAVARVDQQNSKLSADLRRIQREIAALRADLDQPGMREIFGGLGYILGLFGVAAFMASRRKG